MKMVVECDFLRKKYNVILKARYFIIYSHFKFNHNLFIHAFDSNLLSSQYVSSITLGMSEQNKKTPAPMQFILLGVGVQRR